MKKTKLFLLIFIFLSFNCCSRYSYQGNMVPSSFEPENSSLIQTKKVNIRNADKQPKDIFVGAPPKTVMCVPSADNEEKPEENNSCTVY